MTKSFAIMGNVSERKVSLVRMRAPVLVLLRRGRMIACDVRTTVR
jgi:hypothetical protein